MTNCQSNYIFIAGAILGEYFSTFPRGRQPVIWIEDDLTLHIEEFGRISDIIRFDSKLELMKYAQDLALEDADVPEGEFDTHYYLHEINSKALIGLHKRKEWFSQAQDFKYWVEKDLTLHIFLSGVEMIGIRCADFPELARVIHEFLSGIQSQVFAQQEAQFVA